MFALWSNTAQIIHKSLLKILGLICFFHFIRKKDNYRFECSCLGTHFSYTCPLGTQRLKPYSEGKGPCSSQKQVSRWFVPHPLKSSKDGRYKNAKHIFIISEILSLQYSYRLLPIYSFKKDSCLFSRYLSMHLLKNIFINIQSDQNVTDQFIIY